LKPLAIAALIIAFSSPAFAGCRGHGDADSHRFDPDAVFTHAEIADSFKIRGQINRLNPFGKLINTDVLIAIDRAECAGSTREQAIADLFAKAQRQRDSFMPYLNNLPLEDQLLIKRRMQEANSPCDC
jgi:hypothetical protein